MSETPQGDAIRTDTSDMLAVHRALRLALTSAPTLIDAVGSGDVERSGLLGSYLRNVLAFLHIHHEGEDALLYPLLVSRCSDHSELFSLMATQHEQVALLLATAESALSGWSASADPVIGAELVSAIQLLQGELDRHLVDEEQQVLSLASVYCSPDEWGALPGHAMANFSGDNPWLILGLVFEQLSDAQRSATLSHMPPPVAEAWGAVGSAAFASLIGEVRASR